MNSNSCFKKYKNGRENHTEQEEILFPRANKSKDTKETVKDERVRPSRLGTLTLKQVFEKSYLNCK